VESEPIIPVQNPSPAPADNAAQTTAEPGEPEPEPIPVSVLPEQDVQSPHVELGHSKAKPQLPPPPHSSAFVFPAGFLSTSVRGGYRKYDGVSGYQHVERSNIFMYGGMAGKRFALKNRMVRFQAALEAGWGSAKEDAYDYETGIDIIEDVSEYIKLSTYGIQTDMHILFPTLSRSYFLYAGPGLHWSSFSFSVKDNDKIIWKSGNISTASPSFNIGAGMESTLSEYRAVSLSYNFRVWRPVYYTETGDLFPMGVQYEEFFYTHSFHVQILLPGTKKGSFLR